GTTVATKISTAFSPPKYFAMSHSHNSHWVVGNKASIMYNEKNNLEYTMLKPEIVNFDNQRVYSYDPDENTFKPEEYRIEEFEYRRSTFRDIQFIDNRGWIVGRSGIVLSTLDKGKTWMLAKWGTFNFNDIHMINENRGFIAADNGYVLQTTDGGQTWQSLEWDIRSGFNSISFSGNNGVIAGDNGYILRTTNGGENWILRQVEDAKRKRRFVNLNDSFMLNHSAIWLAGNEGVLLFSKNGGATWNATIFREDNYYTVYFHNAREGFAAGDDGTLLYTINGGNNWQREKLPGSRINSIGMNNGNLWCIGDKGMLMQSTDLGKTWTGIEGTSFVIVLLNFFAPFIFIWALFMLMYIVLPNTKVPMKPSAIGAAFTGGIWVIFILLFIFYIKAFARGTFAIYGSLAAFPLVLIMVYASAVIILYGAEVSYTLMNPLSYRNLKRALSDRKDLHIYSAIAIITHIHARFQRGKGSSSFKELLPVSMNDYEELDYFIQMFISEKLLLQTEDNRYIPATMADHVSVLQIVDMVHDVTLKIPGSKTDRLKKHLKDIFSSMQKSRKEILKRVSIQDLVNEVNR
ncbi:MAG: YhjD/YihY/BrkB family envelope integrity protein, partial [Spirochaetota bacterium]